MKVLNHTQTSTKLKSCENLFVHIINSRGPDVLIFCAKHGSVTDVRSLKVQNASTNGLQVMDKQIFIRFKFKNASGGAFYIAKPTWIPSFRYQTSPRYELIVAREQSNRKWRDQSLNMWTPWVWASYQIYKIAGCVQCMRQECQERFLRHQLQAKPLVSDPSIHHGTCVMHVPLCMSESPTCGGGENATVNGVCAICNFTYLVRGPCMQCVLMWPPETAKILLVKLSRMTKIFIDIVNEFKTLRPRQNCLHFPDDIFKCIFLNEIVRNFKISLKFVVIGPINNIPAVVQIMAWRRPGD